MEPDLNPIIEWIGWIVGGALGVAAAAVALVRGIPWRVIKRENLPASNGQKAFQDSLRRDVDRLMAREEKYSERLGALEKNVAVVMDRIRG